MTDGLIGDIVSGAEHLIARAAQDMFGTGGSAARPTPGGAAPTGGTPAGSADSIRWEGMTNAQLATAVRQLNSGPGTSGIQQAADALSTVAGNLQQIDNTLHTQLQAIGINWQSNAGELAQEMTTAAAAYSGSASDAAGANSAGVNAQGDAFAAAKNAVPHPSTLQSPANTFLAGGGGSLTGHENDYAQQVAQTNQARQQAIDTMTTYTSSSQAGVAAHKPAPPPHTYTVAAHPAPVGGGVTSVSGFTPAPPGVGVPGGGVSGGGVPGVPGSGGLPPGLPGVGSPSSGAVPGLPGQTGFPGGSGMPGLPGVPGVGGGGVAGGVPGGGVPGAPGIPGLPGVGGGSGAFGGGDGVAGGVPGGGAAGGTPTGPLAPGPVSGVGAPATGGALPGSAAAQTAAGVGGSFVEDAAIGSAIVGGTVGAGVGGASARQDEVVRNHPTSAVEPEGDGDARSQAARALAELEGEEAEAGLTPGVLEPAVGGRPADDATHANRYAADDDVFGDGRMVVAPVLGDEPGDDPGEPK
jgi:hypothetical protein